MTRKYSIVIWGATGYTGRLTVQYMAEKAVANKNAEGKVTWAIAGRDKNKLEGLKNQIREKYDLDVPYEVASLEDDQRLVDLCKSTSVIVALVGPYTLYGEPMIRACVAAQTHYLDITAELPWVQNMIEKYDVEANMRKIKIIPCCGFDFVPNDMMMLQGMEHMEEKFAKGETNNKHITFETVVHAFRQSTPFVSGGTALSGVQMVRSFKFKDVVDYYVNPYHMCKEKSASASIRPDVVKANKYAILPAKNHRLDTSKYYCTPFVMSNLMNKYINWSNQLQGYPWNVNLRYRGGELRENVWMAYLYSVIIWIQFFLLVCLSYLPFTWKYLPAQGSGPALNPKTDYMESVLHAYTTHESPDNWLKVHWRVEGREAYGTAALFVTEAAILLADVEEERYTPPKPLISGFVSPSACLGKEYLNRLAHTDMQMSVTSTIGQTSKSDEKKSA